eukprot:Cvel_15689.t1-p1 / transcript=Cvel_15689.t1 / gene=Cvel_15689 / organism=Chromera_velia_CCMP2878 / gene_product=hypothetical protein / transcript_product=hypothetical protein / location=Cvel_scaffold1171:5497-9363(-) / protein_length=768 / sequence_SO=supercontig / SO=protein_coding / is_pseudo=false
MTYPHRIFCFGDNSRGQLGIDMPHITHIGHTAMSAQSVNPAFRWYPVGGPDDARYSTTVMLAVRPGDGCLFSHSPCACCNLWEPVGLAAGSDHTCAVYRDALNKEHVFCWGDNRYGQVLGDHEGIDTQTWPRYPPQQLMLSKFIKHHDAITGLTAGSDHSCIVITPANYPRRAPDYEDRELAYAKYKQLKPSAIYCWGAKQDATNYGQLGHSRVQAGAGRDPIAITAGNGFTCATTIPIRNTDTYQRVSGIPARFENYARLLRDFVVAFSSPTKDAQLKGSFGEKRQWANPMVYEWDIWEKWRNGDGDGPEDIDVGQTQCWGRGDLSQSGRLRTQKRSASDAMGRVFFGKGRSSTVLAPAIISKWQWGADSLSSAPVGCCLVSAVTNEQYCTTTSSVLDPNRPTTVELEKMFSVRVPDGCVAEVGGWDQQLQREGWVVIPRTNSGYANQKVDQEILDRLEIIPWWINCHCQGASLLRTPYTYFYASRQESRRNFKRGCCFYDAEEMLGHELCVPQGFSKNLKDVPLTNTFRPDQAGRPPNWEKRIVSYRIAEGCWAHMWAVTLGRGYMLADLEGTGNLRGPLQRRKNYPTTRNGDWDGEAGALECHCKDVLPPSPVSLTSGDSHSCTIVHLTSSFASDPLNLGMQGGRVRNWSRYFVKNPNKVPDEGLTFASLRTWDRDLDPTASAVHSLPFQQRRQRERAINYGQGGLVYCWGSNSKGQVGVGVQGEDSKGYGSETTWGDKMAPVPLGTSLSDRDEEVRQAAKTGVL